MVQTNFPVILLASLVPMIMGFIWYNPKVFGNAWMKEAGLTKESMEGAKMGRIFLMAFIYSFLVSMAIQFAVIHQFHLSSIVMGDPDMNNPNSDLSKMLVGFMAKYGHNYRTFKHGAFHGTIVGIFLALPIIGTGALFERRSGKYVLISAGFWIVCLALMGGIICQFT